MKAIAALVFAIFCSQLVAGKGDHKQVARHLEKRFSGHATYYAVGLGACGQYNNPGDMIVALNTPQYGGGSPGPECFKQIEITSGGVSALATIMDECPGCPYGCLDMSEGLFQHFNALGVGEFPITWNFVDGSGGNGGNGGGNGGGDPPKTTTTPPPPPPPTTHHPAPVRSSTSLTTPTSTPETTSTKTHAKPATLKSHTPSTSTTSSHLPSTTNPTPAAGNFEAMNQFILDLQNMLNDAAGQ